MVPASLVCSRMRPELPGQWQPKILVTTRNACPVAAAGARAPWGKLSHLHRERAAAPHTQHRLAPADHHLLITCCPGAAVTAPPLRGPRASVWGQGTTQPKPQALSGVEPRAQSCRSHHNQGLSSPVHIGHPPPSPQAPGSPRQLLAGPGSEAPRDSAERGVLGACHTRSSG